MRKTTIALIAILTVPAFPARADGQETRATTVSIDDLARQLAVVKQEIRQLRIEYQQLRIASVEHELRQATLNRLQIETESTLLQQDLQEVDENLRQPLDSDSYAKLSEVRQGMVTGRALVLSREQQASARRETDMLKLLDSERRKLRVLQQ